MSNSDNFPGGKIFKAIITIVFLLAFIGAVIKVNLVQGIISGAGLVLVLRSLR